MTKVNQEKYEEFNDFYIGFKQRIDDLYVDFVNVAAENRQLRNEIKRLKEKLKSYQVSE
jgi:hypothetical protein